MKYNTIRYICTAENLIIPPMAKRLNLLTLEGNIPFVVNGIELEFSKLLHLPVKLEFFSHNGEIRGGKKEDVFSTETDSSIFNFLSNKKTLNLEVNDNDELMDIMTVNTRSKVSVSMEICKHSSLVVLVTNYSEEEMSLSITLKFVSMGEG